MNVPFCVESDASGNVYIADLYNNRVRVVNSSGIINTFAGTGSSTFSGDGGPATSAGVHGPEGLCWDAAGNFYIGDNTASSLGDDRIRVVNTSLVINTFAGTGSTGFSGDGGPATAATFNIPGGLARHRSSIYVADQFNNRVRRIGVTNDAPYFTAGTRTVLNMCRSASATNMESLLAITDSDELQPVTWSVLAGPAHGTVSGLPFTWLSNGGSLQPAGQTYTPTSGYGGLDSFSVLIFDGVVYDTIMVAVNIGTPPVVGAISGATSLCSGSTITLTDTSVGGTWRTSSASVASVSATGVVSGLSAGSATISYIVRNTCDSAVATYPITVVTAPVAGTISGPAAVCVGQLNNLSTTGTGGTWTASNTNASVSATGAVTGNTAGADTIIYTVTNACGTATTAQIVTINRLPGAITGAAPLCAGGNSLTLSDTTAAGTWSSSASAVATVSTSGVVTSVGAGSADITYTLPATGCYVTTPLTINPLPAAISGGTNICLYTTLALTETTGGGNWSSSNSTIATVNTTGTVYGNSIGTATISYTLSGTGCYVTHGVNVTSIPPVSYTHLRAHET
ncbi:MAG: hypothetical protein EBZ77_12770, partial [Chitinophagia bacterium]|nr:hypothetical protein [Chitinophagia bacterium]